MQALARFAQDHAALAMLPVSVAGEHADGQAVRVAYRTTVDEVTRDISVTITSSGDCGLPTNADRLVYLGLLQLALRQDPPDETLICRRQDLFDLLEWNRNGEAYDRFSDSVRRLWSVGLVMHSAVLSRDGRQYQQREKGSRIIADYEVASGWGGEVRIRWGDLVLQAFAMNDFKRLDLGLMLELRNPLAARLYQLLDRVLSSGATVWTCDDVGLAAALGCSRSYSAGKLRAVLWPHCDALVARGALDRAEYRRGGTFVFHAPNRLRRALREALVSAGVFDAAARQLVAGYDEARVAAAIDWWTHGDKPADAAAGLLVSALREGWPLRYTEDEQLRFAALWDFLADSDREAYHAASMRLCRTADDLWGAQADPAAWPQEQRAVARFLVTRALEPAAV